METAFEQIQKEFKTIKDNKLSFGIAARRSLPADYSRHCWLFTNLYYLLLSFAQSYVKIPYTSCRLERGIAAGTYKEKAITGDCFFLATAPVTIGQQTYKAFEVYQGSLDRFTIEPYEGEITYLVFYTLKNAPSLPPSSLKQENGSLVFYRGDQAYPLKKASKKQKEKSYTFTKTEGPVVVRFD